MITMHSAPNDGARTPRLQVRCYLPEKQRYTLELLEPPAAGGGAGRRMHVRPANFTLANLSAGTRCVQARSRLWSLRSELLASR
jgi:hypothetical protein